jgi:hypothetical protein
MFHARGLGETAALAALALLVCACKSPGAHDLRKASPAACMPGPRDYAFMWWAYGWGRRSPRGEKVLCVQTGHYGFAIDVEKVRLLRLGRIREAKPATRAVAESNDVVFALPEAELALRVRVGGRTYSCVRAAVHQRDWLNFPVRIVESGRFFQRLDILQLVFEDEQRGRLEAEGRLEIAAWPGHITFILDVTPAMDLPNAELAIALRHDESRLSSSGEPQSSWRAGQKQTVSLSLSPSSADGQAAGAVAAWNAKTDEELRVDCESVYGWHYVELPREAWHPERDHDHLERVRLRLANPGGRERPMRLLFAKDYGFPGITGLCPMLRDSEGCPTGLPVQVSKNWHRREGHTLLYQGPWLHAFALLRLPPKSALDCELTIAYARWGGVPAASHAQLCLIGWGHNQLWDQAAIGSWGESICYDPDAVQQRCMIDDIRPLMVWAMNAKRRKWSWTNNVGGGDFLVYTNDKGQHQRLSRVRTLYESHGPNLTDATYAGLSADGHIAARISVSTPRCDDINRAFHRFRYDVLRPTPFKRLAFYQLGSDNYNWHHDRRMARGNESGVAEAWQPRYQGEGYDRTGIRCDGAAPWLSCYQSLSRDTKGGAWANRGIVVRAWRARLGGRDVARPFASVFRTPGRGFRSTNIELSPPPHLTELKPGDFVDAEVELVITPMAADDYYGPNENLRAALKRGGDTWRSVHREAVGNNLELKALRGTILHRYPIVVEVDKGQDADFEVIGGIGYVPITFVGLDGYRGYGLDQLTDGRLSRVDQSVHGNDYWQTGHNPVTNRWRITYNVCLDSPADEPDMIRFLFYKERN